MDFSDGGMLLLLLLLIMMKRSFQEEGWLQFGEGILLPPDTTRIAIVTIIC